MLDERLKVAASYVRADSRCVDVGTDHAYLAVYLYESGITHSIIACDINEMPLRAAKRTIQQHSLTGEIDVVLSDGLQSISACDAMDIVICGMGGELIMQILSECEYSKEGDRQFILQPMTNVDYLRYELYNNGYVILSETPVLDKGHHYTVMLVRFCGECKEMLPCFCAVGKIAENKSKSGEMYIKHQAQKHTKIARGLRKSASKADEALAHEKLSAEILLTLEG